MWERVTGIYFVMQSLSISQCWNRMGSLVWLGHDALPLHFLLFKGPLWLHFGLWVWRFYCATWWTTSQEETRLCHMETPYQMEVSTHKPLLRSQGMDKTRGTETGTKNSMWWAWSASNGNGSGEEAPGYEFFDPEFTHANSSRGVSVDRTTLYLVVGD